MDVDNRISSHCTDHFVPESSNRTITKLYIKRIDSCAAEALVNLFQFHSNTDISPIQRLENFTQNIKVIILSESEAVH